LYLTQPDPHPRRTYILASDEAQSRFPPLAARLKEDPGWQVHSLIGGHDVMITKPHELADLLHAIG
jgi:hypothetical protein